jgi:anti-sigma-K factor RskA
MASDPHSLVAPYALDALGNEEERAFEEHLATCERCREELAGLREAAAGLAYGADGPPPPPELKERILAQARSERPNVASLQARGRSWTAPLAAAAAVAAAVAIGVGIWSAARSESTNAFTNVLAQPGARVIKMGERGALAVAPSGEAALVLRVPKAPSGKTYEAWVIRADGIRPAGLFSGSDEATVVELSRRVPRGSVIGVTVEKAGGTRQPTQKPFVASAEIT